MATKSLAKNPKKPRQKPSSNGTASSDGWPVLVPAGAGTLEGFRAWTASPNFPETGKIAFLGGEIFIDMSAERVDSHAAVKFEVVRVVGSYVVKALLGEFYVDGIRLVDEDTELSNEPDASFISWERYKSGLIERVPAADAKDTIEFNGSPDWVMEIVSPSSVGKDKQRLMELYFAAGVAEYWLIDARSEVLEFAVLKRGDQCFIPAESKKGRAWSNVFKAWFKLVRKVNQAGNVAYVLEKRAK